MRILCLNSGSSTLKFAVWDFARGEVCLLADEMRSVKDAADGVRKIWSALKSRGLLPVAGVGHRVVFGGVDHGAPARIDPALLAELHALSHFAPLHMPAGLAAIDAAMGEAPDAIHVACFDTAFHRRMPAVAQRLPLPRALWNEGLRRFGYHGLSYEYVVATLGDAQCGRCVIAHLGNGASLAALRDGAPIDTTMGLSPNGGLMMGTRTGDLDPGIWLHLARHKHLDADALERVLTRESGLLGVSGTSGDMQELLSRRAADPRAAEAVELFCFVARKHIGAMAAALGGLDSLVFTGGIGEHAAPIRAEVCEGLGYLGVRLAPDLNERHAGTIGADGASCSVHVVRTDENLMIARHARAVIGGQP